MMNFFGKKKKEEPTTMLATSARSSTTTDPQTTIVTLRETIASQEKREEHINRKIDSMVTEAKAKLAKGDKKGALYAMKRKKLFEAEVDKIQNVKMTLETQVMNLESATNNAATFNAMKQGTNTMKKIRTEVGIDNVDNIMDEIKEEMELAHEINEAIAQPIDPFLADEDELLAELNALEENDLEAELLKPTPSSKVEQSLSMPHAPSSKLPSLAKDEEDDLRKLEAELAGL